MFYFLTWTKQKQELPSICLDHNIEKLDLSISRAYFHTGYKVFLQWTTNVQNKHVITHGLCSILHSWQQNITSIVKLDPNDDTRWNPHNSLHLLPIKQHSNFYHTSHIPFLHLNEFVWPTPPWALRSRFYFYNGHKKIDQVLPHKEMMSIRQQNDMDQIR